MRILTPSSSTAVSDGLLAYLDRKLDPHDGHGPEFAFFCPFCIHRLGDESDKPKLRVNLDKGMACCFRCEYGCKSMKQLLRDINGGKLGVEELKVLQAEGVPVGAGLVHTTVVQTLNPSKAKREDSLLAVPPPKEAIPLWGDGLDKIIARPAKIYLMKRGVTKALLKRHRVMYCPTGKRTGHLVFPIFMEGKSVYWTTRFCGEAKMKSYNPSNTPGYYTREHVLLGYDACVAKSVVPIVEGPFSMMAFPHAVATMGKNISDYQVKLFEALAGYGTKEFVLALDAEVDPGPYLRRLTPCLPLVSCLQLDWGDPWDRR